MHSPVGNFMTADVLKVSSQTPINNIILQLRETKGSLIACVVDKNDKLIGIITPKRLLKEANISESDSPRYPSLEWGEILSSMTSKCAEDLMGPPINVASTDFLVDAIDLMIDKNLYELPVTDKTGKLIGEIKFSAIISHWASHLNE